MSIYNASGTAINAAYEADGTAAPIAYDAAGTEVWRAWHDTDYSSYSFANIRNIAINNTQGMELCNGVLIQFRGQSSATGINNLVCLYDFTTGDAIYADMPITAGHANAVTFGNERYDPADEFPLIYCGDWFEPKVHVNRITRTGATHLYDIVYDEATAGYHSNPCIDFANGILYTVGYYLNDTHTATDNHCIVCAWDLNNMTDNGDDTFTPALLGSYTRDFIYVMQDLKFSDGLVWITAGANSTEYLYGMNPSTGVFAHTIPVLYNLELEGLVWQRDEQTGLYSAIVGLYGGNYYQITFAEATNV